MAITWNAKCICDEYDCYASEEVEVTLNAKHEIDVDLPTGWQLKRVYNDDSGRDPSEPNVPRYEYLCPEHAH
jgi:hypothetical protein